MYVYVKGDLTMDLALIVVLGIIIVAIKVKGLF
jgi:F0F1-type ATP synthase membrane subunit a